MLNKCQFIGRVGKDPEFKSISSGNNVANITIAASEKYKNKSDEWVESVEWVNCQAWGKLADIINEYVKKGMLLYVEGKLKTEMWEKDGVKHYATKIILSEMKMLEGKKEPERTQNAQPTQKPYVIPEDNVSNNEGTGYLPF